MEWKKKKTRLYLNQLIIKASSRKYRSHSLAEIKWSCVKRIDILGVLEKKLHNRYDGNGNWRVFSL